MKKTWILGLTLIVGLGMSCSNNHEEKYKQKTL